jgi:hypothetical protein
MLQKYAALRAAAGVTVDRSKWDGWKATTYLRTGQRWRSLKALSGADGAGGRLPRVGRSMIVTALPGAVRLRDYRQGRRVPPDWRADAERWLSELTR